MMAEFNALVVEELPRLRRYAASLTRDRQTAEDLVQETILRALSREALYERDTNIAAWLLTILRNEYISGLRRTGRRGVTVQIDPDAASFVTSSPQIDTLVWRDLERALADLPEGQRDAVLLIGLEGMNYAEAASALDVPIGTLRSRVSRGREALRVLISAQRVPGRDSSRGRTPRRFSMERYLHARQTGGRRQVSRQPTGKAAARV
jgi:RNA polymerase sigma-70 factor (ECF subfamily)